MWRNLLRKTRFCGGELQFLLWRRGLSSSTSGEPGARSRFAAVWGNGDYGRLGVGGLESQWRPKPILCSSFHNQSLKSIACGGAHTLFLTGFIKKSDLWGFYFLPEFVIACVSKFKSLTDYNFLIRQKLGGFMPQVSMILDS